jgi:hypothetical protein
MLDLPDGISRGPRLLLPRGVDAVFHGQPDSEPDENSNMDIFEIR